MRGSHISLFAGIGGFDIAAEAAGFETIATAESDPFCRSVLKARYPNAVHLPDVRDVSPGPVPGYVRQPLLVSAGFPCQDVSGLGAGGGLSGARSGLWSEAARVIREFQPEYVLLENVALLRSRGLDQVLSDLVGQGYDVRWDGIPAAVVGAPHYRDRLFIWAKLNGDDPFYGSGVWFSGKLPRAGELVQGEFSQRPSQFPLRRGLGLLPTPRSAPNEWRTTRNAPSHGNGHGKTLAGELNDRERRAGRTPAPSSESAGNINPCFVEWMMGFPENWTDPRFASPFPHQGWSQMPDLDITQANSYARKSRLMALGNALVPQAAAIALDNLLNW